MRRRLATISLALSASCLSFVKAGEAEEHFRDRVWPLLDRSCVKCHGPEKQKGGLRLDSREALMKGGEKGPAVVPGKPAESLLVKLVRHPIDTERMPPKEQLSDADVAAIERWIKQEAPWPAVALPHVASTVEGRIGDAWTDKRNPIVRIFGGQRLDLWSLRPISNPDPPPVRDTGWPRQPLDRFVLARIESAGEAPAPPADARSLCRRLYYDFTGLPPTPDEAAQFASAYSGDASGAVGALVDRLLASPQYGEHSARLWLDVLRYSDSNGFDWDEFRPQAWRFRDYVIRSMNADKPFDRFIREMLAGDEMLTGPPRDAAEQDCLVATGYLRMGPHDNSAKLFGEDKKVRQQLMADLVETTGSAFLGLTMACARCHDHKFDPISQADHYRLQAFFEGVKFADELPLNLAPEQESIREHNKAVDARVKTEKEKRAAILNPAKEKLKKAGKKDPSDDDAKKELNEEEKKRLKEADAAVQKEESTRKPFVKGLLMTDGGDKADETKVLYQGQLSDPREAVVPGFISVLDPNAAAIAKSAREASTGRRTALAAWVVSEQNPLTARVIVNRVWQSFFGEGLVATPNDFGLAGSPPHDPALLDWLARAFMRDGWSMKKLQRLIATSATYQQAALTTHHAWRSPKPRRLTAEQLRDSLLLVAGNLRESKGGAPVWPELPADVLTANPAFLDDNSEKTKGWYPSPPEERNVRSVYLIQKRTVRIPMMETFDLPENAVTCARRNVSTVAPQALTLLNSPFAAEMAKAFAARVAREAGEDRAAQVQRAFLLAFQRKPGAEEIEAAQRFLERRTLVEFCRVVMNLNEWIYLD